MIDLEWPNKKSSTIATRNTNAFMHVGAIFGLHTYTMLAFIQSLGFDMVYRAQQTASDGWSLPFYPCSNCLFLLSPHKIFKVSIQIQFTYFYIISLQKK